MLWPVKEKKYTKNPKEGWGQDAKNRFEELLDQEIANRKLYMDETVDKEPKERVDRFEYDPKKVGDMNNADDDNIMSDIEEEIDWANMVLVPV